MNIYEQIEKCFPGKSVSLHVIHNKDKSITTLIEPKITDDDEKFNHPITFTTSVKDGQMTSEKAQETLERAFEQIQEAKISGEPDDEIKGIKESSDQIEEEDGGTKNKASKPAKKVAVKKAVAKKEVKKPEPKKIEKLAKVDKEEEKRRSKLTSSIDKLTVAIDKKDIAIAEFWLKEIVSITKDDDKHDIEEMSREVKKLSKENKTSEPKSDNSAADDSAKKVEEYERENAESIEQGEGIHQAIIEDKSEDLIEEKKENTEPSKDGDTIPMPN